MSHGTNDPSLPSFRPSDPSARRRPRRSSIRGVPPRDTSQADGGQGVLGGRGAPGRAGRPEPGNAEANKAGDQRPIRLRPDDRPADTARPANPQSRRRTYSLTPEGESAPSRTISQHSTPYGSSHGASNTPGHGGQSYGQQGGQSYGQPRQAGPVPGAQRSQIPSFAPASRRSPAPGNHQGGYSAPGHYPPAQRPPLGGQARPGESPWGVAPSGGTGPGYGPGGPRPASPVAPGVPAGPHDPRQGKARRRRRRRPLRRIATVLVLLLVLAIAWPIGLYLWAEDKFDGIEALSGAANTPGTTYLLAGSDERTDDSMVTDGAEGHRSDSIMLIHVPDKGNTSLLSLPRDSYVEIPGHGMRKLNAAFSIGGAPLLVQTVEKLTGLTIDHYVQIGMGGVMHLVDAVGGVELCLDYDVDDFYSNLKWTAGCHHADGKTALAFSRMRYADPLGDIGRTLRQRQVVSKVIKKAITPKVLLNPFKQVDLINAGAEVLTIDNKSNLRDLTKLVFAMRKSSDPNAVVGTPPIKDLNYRPGKVGSTVLLDPDLGPIFWKKVADGSVTRADLHGSGD